MSDDVPGDAPEVEGHDARPQGGSPDEGSHDDGGLELARALTRATAGRMPRSSAPRKRSRSRSQAPGPAAGDDRDPQMLDAVVRRLVDDHGWELDLRVHGVFGRWPELVGAEVAQHCRPESFAEGRLVVRADSTAWATQLRLLAATVLKRLNEELGHDTVTLIEVLGPHGPSWKRGPRSVKGGRGPRDTYG